MSSNHQALRVPTFPQGVSVEKGVVWAETNSLCLVWPFEGVLVQQGV
jgi:hypothetical protein